MDRQTALDRSQPLPKENETYPPSSEHAKQENERSLKRFSLVNCVDYVRRRSS